MKSSSCGKGGGGVRRRGEGKKKEVKVAFCQKWDLNPRLQRRLRPERSALDRSAILTGGERQTVLQTAVDGFIDDFTLASCGKGGGGVRERRRK